MAKITVRVQPGASRNAVVANVEGIWKIAVAAPPIEGRANQTCAEFLAKLLGKRKRDVALTSGAKSRIKTFAVSDATAEEIEARLTEAAK